MKIPEYTSSVTPQGPENIGVLRATPSDIAAAQSVPAAIADFTKSVEGLAVTGMRADAVLERKRNAANVVEKTDMLTEAIGSLRLNMSKVAGNNVNEDADGNNLYTREIAKVNKLIGDIRGLLPTEEQQRLFNVHAEDRKRNYLYEVVTHQAKEDASWRATTAMNGLASAIKELDANPYADVNKLKLEVAARFRAIYPGQDVDDKILKAMNLLDEKHKAIRDNAITTIEVAGLLRDYAGKFPDDPEQGLLAAIDKAESPDFVEKHGEQISERVSSALNRRLQQENRKYTKLADEIGQDFVQKMTKGELSDDIIDSSKLRTGDKIKFKNMRYEREQRVAKEIKAEQAAKNAADQAEYAKLMHEHNELRWAREDKSKEVKGKIFLAMAHGDPKYKTATDIINEIPNGLDPDHVHSVISIFNSVYQDPLIKNAMKLGMKELQDSLITPKLQSPTQKARFDKAVAAYTDAVDKGRRDGTLTSPDQVRDLAKEILKAPEYSNVNPLEDKMADFRKLQGRVNKTDADKKIVGYIKGKPVYDIGGGQWEIGE